MTRQNAITFGNGDLDLEFEFWIYGYESPNAIGGAADWLLVGIECRYQSKVFAKMDPSIEAPELEGICEWFQSISLNTIPKHTHLSFTEPNLEFQPLGSTGKTIRFGIKLDAECKPPFFIRELSAEPHSDFVMAFEDSLDEIVDHAARFREMKSSFPCRNDR